jgi:lipopolysaccharide transport system ATP-binding protein
VTHCDSAILINDGVMLMQDSPRVVVNKYLDLLFGKTTEKEAVADEIESNIEQQRIEEKQQELLKPELVERWANL